MAEPCCFTWSNMPMAVATTPEMSFGLSGTITKLLCFAISASSETYLSASRCTIASLPPSSLTASAIARKPSAVASAAIRVEAARVGVSRGLRVRGALRGGAAR